MNCAVLGACTGVIFHTARIAAERSNEAGRWLTLGIYAMNDRTLSASSGRNRHSDRPLVVAPCSYGFDEPIDVLFAALEGLPEISAALTGNPAVDLPEEGSRECAVHRVSLR